MQSAKAKINSLFISFVYYNFTLQYYNLVATPLLQKCYKFVTLFWASGGVFACQKEEETPSFCGEGVIGLHRE